MAYTSTLTVTSVAAAKVLANTYCRKIIVFESPSVAGWPTTQFIATKVTPGSAGVRMLAGVQYVFEKEGGSHFYPGEQAGTLQTVTGSTTFNQDESD